MKINEGSMSDLRLLNHGSGSGSAREFSNISGLQVLANKETAEEIQNMQKSKHNISGYLSGNAHSSLLLNEPTPKPNAAYYLSPKLNTKARSILAHPYGPDENYISRNGNLGITELQTTPLSPTHQNDHIFGRKNSVGPSSATTGKLNPINHSPVNYTRGANTIKSARPANSIVE